MKLPFDLGVKLFFRLLLPGFFFTLGVWPVLLLLLAASGLAEQAEIGFVLTVIVSGWLIVAADMRIYMLLEGRRFWPARVASWLRRSEERRLQKLKQRVDAYYQRPEGQSDVHTRRRYLEASVDLRSLPMGDDGEWYVEFPTRLGNTIHAFETYSKTRYDLEAIFYWPRIWVNLDKDLREELDGQQALTDSCVYSVFSLGTTALLWVLYAVLVMLEWLIAAEPSAPGGDIALGTGLFRFLPPLTACLAVSAVFLILSALAYRLAISTNEQFGVSFMAIIDGHARKVRGDYVGVSEIAKKVGVLAGISIDDTEELEVARRYLQYYNVKLPGQRRTVPVPKLDPKANAKD